jgi:SAM-dependent methyltransferase
VLLRAPIPEAHRDWNRRWGAPRGRPWRLVAPRRWRHLPGLAGASGYFAFQPNSDTRAAEYPWAFESLALAPGMRVLEIGGSMSGFQFVLDRSGCEVVNVDPGRGWAVPPSRHGVLNRRFGTRVRLVSDVLERADLPDASFDRAVSISTLEHVPEAHIPGILAHVRRLLRPGGLLVASVDLFLDLRPFTDKAENRWGRNVSMRALVEASGLEPVRLEPSELHGYPEFDAARILARRREFVVGRSWPVMVQTVVLRRPA